MSQLISPELVARLTSASERIRKATEDLEQSVLAVEQYLASVNLGIPAAAWIEQPDAPYRLRFGPESQSPDQPWRLRIERIRPGSTGGATGQIQVETSWLIDEVPKRLLLAAAPAVPNLVESIAAAAAEEAARVEDALSRLRGPSDEVTIVDRKTRERLDRDFLEMYAKRMGEEAARGAAR